MLMIRLLYFLLIETFKLFNLPHNAVGEWFSLNRLLVNCDKTSAMLFGSKTRLARSQGLSLFLLGKLGVV